MTTDPPVDPDRLAELLETVRAELEGAPFLNETLRRALAGAGGRAPQAAVIALTLFGLGREAEGTAGVRAGRRALDQAWASDAYLRLTREFDLLDAIAPTRGGRGR